MFEGEMGKCGKSVDREVKHCISVFVNNSIRNLSDDALKRRSTSTRTV